ncbi:leucine-rich repeat domain-containing protein [Tessaracoccus antarcticus]|uniref:Leucine-rich repeat domain-containing protein n=1 Tax=Tessaracoccus antarcticus TaxID=2479848 RepID=A0A3M0FZN6_9ACTN|nr:leucine-rich repeat domain-containing protein [Tessaracoccus antarcticus]RMB58191.1 leucine-rich repeat domain-containing protein [Tessaracoccus antarcticus]
MKRKVAWALAAVMVAVSAAMGGTVPARADVNPYITEGTHHVNGRDWRTTCEPYSQTTRCRTEIKATQVSEVGGRFVVRTGWYFNNLTYLPSSRSLWKKNPLGSTGTFTGADGRTWSTVCDTAETGRNGCRTYAEARVIEPYQVNGVWHYKWVTRSIFNNIVQFTVAPVVKPSAPPVTTASVTLPDAKLRECINVSLRKPITSAIPVKVAATITDLDCTESKVSNLTGLEQFKNLETLYLDFNQISNLAPLRGLSKLQNLSLAGNAISDLRPLGPLTGLLSLDVSDNRIVDASPVRTLTSLELLSLSTNQVRNVAPVTGLIALTFLDLSENDISDVSGLRALTRLEGLSMAFTSVDSLAPLAGMKKLGFLDVTNAQISDVSALTSLTALEALFLDGNSVEDVTDLAGLKKLSMLSLSGNGITDVAPLAKLVNLEWLMLAINDITVVKPLATLPKLHILGLWDNPILDRASLDPLVARGCMVMFDEPDDQDDSWLPGIQAVSQMPARR